MPDPQTSRTRRHHNGAVYLATSDGRRCCQERGFLLWPVSFLCCCSTEHHPQDRA